MDTRPRRTRLTRRFAEQASSLNFESASEARENASNVAEQCEGLTQTAGQEIKIRFVVTGLGQQFRHSKSLKCPFAILVHPFGFAESFCSRNSLAASWPTVRASRDCPVNERAFIKPNRIRAALCSSPARSSAWIACL